ncbi:MAG: hypothetical protein HY318_01390 [Armatimonadetes bacterium]|nr:hypothetical protein [Armatimonadota bacterium]
MRTLIYLPLHCLILSSLWFQLCFAEGEKVLYEEHFHYKDGNLPPGWEVLEGSARVDRGRLHITSDRQNPRVQLNKSFAGDLSISLRLTNAPACHWSGAVAKGIYWLTVNHEYSSLFLDRRGGPVPSGVAAEAVGRQLAKQDSYGLYLWDAYDSVMRFECRGVKVRAYLDDRLCFEAEDVAMPTEGPLMLVGGWGTNVYMDDIVVTTLTRPWAERRALNPSKPTLPEFKATLDRTDAIYYDGETAQLTVTWRSGETTEATLRPTLVDLYEKEIAGPTIRVPVSAGTVARAVLPLKAPRRGIFKVRLTAEFNGKSAAQGDVTGFAVILRSLGERPPIPSSPFGGHPHWEVPEFHYALGRKMGMKWARNHDAIQYTWWPRVQPERDQWRWDDEDIALLRRNNLNLLGEFMWTPKWAARMGVDPGAAAMLPPQNMEDFGNYVFETVKHYRGVVDCWEVWNEPHYAGFWRGTPEEYAEMVKVAYQAAKRANPEAVILGGGGVALISPTRGWTERAVKAGLLNYCDAYSFHYSYEGQPFDGSLQRFRDEVSHLRALMRQHGGEKPLWNTEATAMSTSFLDQYRVGFDESDAHYHFREAAFKLVRMYVVDLAEGVRKVFYYDLLWPRRDAFIEGFHKTPVSGGLLELHGGLKPTAVAYATTADLLEGAAFRQVVDLAPHASAYVFTRGQEKVVVYWVNSGHRPTLKRMTLRARGKWTLCDVMNNRTVMNPNKGLMRTPLSREPFFMLVSGISTSDIITSLKKAVVK